MEERKQGTGSGICAHKDGSCPRGVPKPEDPKQPVDLTTGKPTNPDLEEPVIGMDKVHGLRERLAEQSKAIQAIDDHLKQVRETHGQHARETDDLHKSVEGRLDMLEEFVQGFAAREESLRLLETRLARTEKDLVEHFPKRLDALGDQVAKLIHVGERIAATEKIAHASDRLATDLAELVKTKLGELEQIGKDLKQVMDRDKPQRAADAVREETVGAAIDKEQGRAEANAG